MHPLRNRNEQLKVFRDNSGGANGLFFGRTGNLLVCEGNNKRLVCITPERPTNVTFGGKEGKTLFITARSYLCKVAL